MRDETTGILETPADYSQLGDLIIVSILIGLVLPFTAILIVRMSRLEWA